ncbi:MAG: oligopeptide transporter, OPT family [Holophagales bacterium]|nr:oligopeptide transporter, OPT family [Holophagales bacterium]
MSKPAAHSQPYVTAEQNMTEITVRALVLGGILSIVMGAANTYLGLYAGMTVSASIPAAVISMAILRGILRRGSILENNIVQTMASTGESLAAGVIFTVPALVMIGSWQNFEFWPTTLITMLGGILGIVFMVPMRRALIVDRPDLVYPEGVACSEVLIVGEEKGEGIKAIAQGVALGGLFKVLVSGTQVVQSVVQTGFAKGRSVFYAGSDMSVALLAVGYLVNLQIASLITLGGAIGWLVAIPLLGGFEGGHPVEHADMLWSTQVRYIGVGTMLVGGLWSIFQVRSGIVAGLRALQGVKASSDAKSSVPRTERNLPLPVLMGVFLAATFATFLFYDFLVGNLGVAALTAVLMVLTSFLFVAVATYIAGLVGSSNSPVSGMTICALLIAAGVLLALGIKGDQAILATLGIAGVVCCATCTSGDVAQDLKTGLLVGATPARQQATELIAAVIPAFFFAPILTLLHQAYGIGTGEPGSLRAPQAALFASLTESFFGDSQLPWNMILIGGAIGVGLIVANHLLEASGSSFRTHVMPVAVGIYLPFSLAVPIFAGGLLRWAMSRHRGKAGETSDARDHGVLFGSGLIAGEALVGIGLAGAIAAGIALPIVLLDHWLPSLLVFGAVVAYFWRVARR